MDETARVAAENAAERVRQLTERRERLLAGVGSTAADVIEASRLAAASLVRARAAHARAGLAHDRAAVAHDRAALALETRARRSAGPLDPALMDEAQRHRRAAGADREAAHDDRRQALSEVESAPEAAPDDDPEAGPEADPTPGTV